MFIFTFILSSIYSFSSYALRTDLTTSEIALLKNGKQIKQAVTIEGQIWPKVIVVSLIPHTPKQNMEVFSQFESHRKFIPNLTKSKIVRKEGNATDVSFEMDMPMPVSNSLYTTRHILENTGDDYKISWSLLKSNQMKSSNGFVVFEAFEGKTLFTYENHISPDSSFAGLFTSRVKSDVEKTVKIIIKHLDKSIQ